MKLTTMSTNGTTDADDDTDESKTTDPDVLDTQDSAIVDAVLDNVTDIIALAVIGAILLYFGQPSVETLAAIVSIALGKRFLGPTRQ